MSTPTTTSLYPPGGYGAPKGRRGHAADSDVGLPEGTVKARLFRGRELLRVKLKENV